MSEEIKIGIEEVQSLDMPVKTSTDKKPVAEISLPGMMTIPSGIYKHYGQRKFRLLREAKERLKTTLLDMDTWNTLWQIDGRRTVAQVSENLMMPLEIVVYHVECLKYMGIVCPVGAIYLPEFIIEKTEKKPTYEGKRKEDSGSD